MIALVLSHGTKNLILGVLAHGLPRYCCSYDYRQIKSSERSDLPCCHEAIGRTSREGIQPFSGELVF